MSSISIISQVIYIQFHLENMTIPRNLSPISRHHPAKGKMLKAAVKSKECPGEIYSDVFDEMGGMIGTCAAIDLPKSIHQVSYEKKKLREDKVDELQNFLKSHYCPEILNFEASPTPRAVIASQFQIQDVIDNCTITEEIY